MTYKQTWKDWKLVAGRWSRHRDDASIEGIDQHIFDNLKTKIGLDKNFVDTFIDQVSEIID